MMKKFVICASFATAILSGCSHSSQFLPESERPVGRLGAVGAASTLSGDRSDELRKSINGKLPKNVILLIGDGMGYAELTAARNYELGAGGRFKGLDALPFTGSYTHYSLYKETGKPNYVTDSAAAATSWAIGAKTYNGALGVDIEGKPQPNLIEQLKAAGIGTGNVTTAFIQDATPGAQVAHVTSRKCIGPEATGKECPANAVENGGAGSISEQMLDTRPDVSMGGGMKSFKETAKAGRWAGKTVLEQAKARGFNVVTDARQLAAVRSADDKSPLLGLFAENDMPPRWSGPRAVNKGYAGSEPEVVCGNNPQRGENVPTLAAMTQKAIDLLEKNPKGFFLQVEGASIDKQSHAANPCGQIGETVDFDEAVQVALKFAAQNRETLVIVGSDHAQSIQILPETTNSPGLTQKLRTKEGSVMYVGYSTETPGERVNMKHTGAQVRVAAYGPQAANVTGLLDQTDLHFMVKRAFKLGETAR